MSGFMLDDLLQAVADAVMSAQRFLDARHQDLSHLFQPRGTAAGSAGGADEGALEPLTVPLVLPKSVVTDGEPAEGVHNVPLATLVPHQAVALESMKLSIPCLVEGLSGGTGQKQVSIVLGSSLPTRHAGLATLSLEFRHAEPTEGMARINDQLLKKF